MTIFKALESVDAGSYNTYSQAQKIAWLSQLDSMIKTQILDAYEPDGEHPAFSGYDENTELDTRLLVPEPFDEVYLYWLESRIDYANNEYARFNNSNAMYAVALQRFADHYHRTHKPLSSGAFH